MLITSPPRYSLPSMIRNFNFPHFDTSFPWIPFTVDSIQTYTIRTRFGSVTVNFLNAPPHGLITYISRLMSRLSGFLNTRRHSHFRGVKRKILKSKNKSSKPWKARWTNFQDVTIHWKSMMTSPLAWCVTVNVITTTITMMRAIMCDVWRLWIIKYGA